jgi:hypothetical protein
LIHFSRRVMLTLSFHAVQICLAKISPPNILEFESVRFLIEVVEIIHLHEVDYLDVITLVLNLHSNDLLRISRLTVATTIPSS